MADGQVVFEITGDNRPIEQSLRDTTRAIDRESRNWDASTRETAGNMENSMVSMFKKVAASAAAAKIGQFLLNIGKEAVSLASDLQEVQNVVDVTFGESASAIQSWANKAKTQFGLTELQAKQFTSTLGAMMKSAGLAGPEIVDMSTSLAGLAADMASFYNLDFETAFQKIRAGISGETEPLKQLGVNMSVANLEAYALTQGITKAFDKMSQSEQTVLRYQYLMQATADAQGDFARTSSGSFANMKRNIETNLTSIKSSIGNLLIGPVQEATGVISSFLAELTKPADRTVLDDFSDIEEETTKKLAEIQTTVDSANAVVESMKELGGAQIGTAMENIASGANALKSDSPGIWQALLSALNDSKGLEGIFSGTGQNITDLAQALSGNSPDKSKATAWKEFLDALGNNAGALSELTKTSPEDAKKWLEEIAVAANSLEPDNAEGWNKLLSNFVSGLPGFKDTDAGKKFFDAISIELLAMGNESDDAKNALSALGLSTDEIAEKQSRWLDYCKRLVQEMPGLSSIVDEQTGEIKGGTEALQKYITQWAQMETLAARLNDLDKKRAAIMEHADITSYQNDVAYKRNLLKVYIDDYNRKYGTGISVDDFINENKGFSQNGAARASIDTVKAAGAEMLAASVGSMFSGLSGEQLYDMTKLLGILDDLNDAEDAYNRQVEANADAQLQFAANEATYQELLNEYGMTEDEVRKKTQAATGAIDSQSKSMSILARAAGDDTDAMNKVKAALENAQEAFKNLADYQEKVRQETAQSVAQVIKGFESMGEKGADGLWAWNTPAEEASRKTKDLTEQMSKLNTNTKEGKKQWEALQAQVNQLGGNKASVQNMTQSLESQLAYIREYKKMMDEARRRGVSEEILSSLSDGSQQSFDYLKALTTTGGEITGEGGLNDLYRQVQEESAGFVDELTKQKLAADETYHGLVATAQQAIASLNLGETAYNSVAATVDGIVKALGDKKTEVKSQVDGILFQIGRLGLASGYGTNFNRNGMLYFSAPKPKGSQANGLDYVPYDGLFMLHQGERVETAAENELSRHYSNRAPGFDYNAMGSAVGANMPNMGNMQIVWHGRVVADVLSGMQADSYRALERSGWQQ
jgi:hypothetical protein